MLHFNGPALAAEAQRRQRLADDPGLPDRVLESHRSAAQTYATLALTAAVLSTAAQHIADEDTIHWTAALGVGLQAGGLR